MPQNLIVLICWSLIENAVGDGCWNWLGHIYCDIYHCHPHCKAKLLAIVPFFHSFVLQKAGMSRHHQICSTKPRGWPLVLNRFSQFELFWQSWTLFYSFCCILRNGINAFLSAKALFKQETCEILCSLPYLIWWLDSKQISCDVQNYTYPTFLTHFSLCQTGLLPPSSLTT